MTVWELFGYGRAEETADSVFSFGRPIQIHAEKKWRKNHCLGEKQEQKRTEKKAEQMIPHLW